MSMIASHFNYWVVIALMMAGLFVMIQRGHLVRKLVGLSVFQASTFIFYISLSKVSGGTAPILDDRFQVYSAPLPHVLILTAIVVGIATLALGLALVVRINEAYGCVDEDELALHDSEDELDQRDGGA